MAQEQKRQGMETVSATIVGVIVVATLAEAILSAAEHWTNYERKETLVNLGIAAIGAAVNIFVKGFVIIVFVYVSCFALLDIEESVWSWLSVFLLVDLQYYLFHWLGHKSRFFWAMHVIHHSSHKYNFTTALRTPFTNSAFRFGSMLPIVVLGFDPMHVLIMDTVVLGFSFLQHTELVRKLGWLEYVFSTPSHHRVHHASDEKYLDKNFGGVLILWDKLFGTFQVEEERPTYGLTTPLTDTTLVNVITHEWRAIFQDVSSTRNLGHRIQYVFGRPGWKPTERSCLKLSFVSLPKYLLISLTLFVITTFSGFAQATDYLKAGRAAESRFEDDIALNHYMKAMASDPSLAEAFWRASRLYAAKAGRTPDKTIKFTFASEANRLATEAIRIAPKDEEARLSLIVSLGMLSEAATSPREKLKNAKVIRTEAEQLLHRNPNYAPACYVLGKWHYELSRLNWLERTACDLLFGGMPEGVSLDKSIQFFNKAVALQPDCIMFRYGHACALFDRGEYQRAAKLLDDAMRLPAKEPDDTARLKKCATLLDKTRQALNQGA
jgi:sterol desaturase/sphingolipid hydroxylase (fatty acid hydroxylase superfamily)/tetratricopeptide (TPR) repeat protein